MSEDEASREEQWSRFLKVWPIERIKTLTLEEYTTSADDRTGDNPDYPFTYWLESLTEDLGSIGGGLLLNLVFFVEKTNPKKRLKALGPIAINMDGTLNLAPILMKHLKV